MSSFSGSRVASTVDSPAKFRPPPLVVRWGQLVTPADAKKIDQLGTSDLQAAEAKRLALGQINVSAQRTTLVPVRRRCGKVLVGR